ncbi:MAG TPA: hypothetical protein VD735_01470 [Candidatus Saccharimonadales bacterium]|nr:hypothetical protein [Candidatus Saccharimonadales bacterium]
MSELVVGGGEAEGLQPYPYYDPRFHTGEVQLNATTQIALEAVQGLPVVEIGGPTTRGFRMLGQKALFRQPPLITNIHGPQADAHMNGAALALPDERIGMCLASHIGTSDYFRHPDVLQDDIIAGAAAEYEAFIADPAYKPNYNLRLKILSEMHRVIVPGGLAVMEAIGVEDVAAMHSLGWRELQIQTVRRPTASLVDGVFIKPL